MHCRVRISATSEDEANTISKTLVREKLVAGTMIYSGNCHYWWDGEIVDREYWNIGGFTLGEHKDAIIAKVRELHSDECPIVALNEVDGNADFFAWIEESLK